MFSPHSVSHPQNTNLSLILIYTLLLFTGVFSSGELLNFSLAVEMNPIKIKATAIGLANTMVACGGLIMQPMIGFMLDLYSDGKLESGVRSYTASIYQLALSILPVTLIVAFLLTLFLKETKYKEVNEPIPPD